MTPKGSISQRVRELAQLVRAGVLYASGHRFNPCIPYHRHEGSISQRGLGVVAQSVEASDLKSVQSGFESQLPYHSQRKHKSKGMVEVGGIEPPSEQVPHEVLLVESPFHPRTNLI